MILLQKSEGPTFEAVPRYEIARTACLACTDFANDYADISAGGLGSPDGYTTILIRTENGSDVYSEALRQGYVEERAFTHAAELSSEKTKMMAKVVAFARQKRGRGEARLAEVASIQPPERESEGGNHGE